MVSLLMAAYTPDRRWLRAAVDSALAQRDCSFELIVVDDGSPEPVAGLLADIDDPRLSVLRIEHGGDSCARNAGIAAAQGAYLRFLDADDFYPAESTAALLSLASSQSGSVLACGATRWCREDLTPILDWPARCPPDATSSYLLLRCTPMYPSILFPRTVVETIGPFDEAFAVGGDWDFTLRAMDHARVAETRQATTWYRRHSESASRNVAEAWRGTVLGVQRYFERHPEEREGPMARQVAAMLDMLAAELDQDRSPWLHPRLWRGLARDPSAIQTIYARLVLPPLQRFRWRIGAHRPG